MTGYASALIAGLALLMVALVGVGALTAFERLTTSLADVSRRSEELLRAPATPSPLDRVRTALTQ